MVQESLAAPFWPNPFLRLSPSMPLASLGRYGAKRTGLQSSEKVCECLSSLC